MTADHPSAALDATLAAIRAGDRARLARAITLIESTRADHRREAEALLQAMLPHSGRAIRIGITGVPGVGKSTTIDQLGFNLAEAGQRVAVLAVDPTSRRTGGSILGDKTRMARLACHANAFIRPSPTSGTLGGVARRTRETIVAVEAAGFDVVIVETVGVGQSETTVAGMVDFFLVLLLPGGGDDLQGIKKGIIEIADMLAINKADGDSLARATRTAADYRSALSILTPASPTWHPPVVTLSGLTNKGLDELWQHVCDHRAKLTASGELTEKRRAQAVEWMREMLAENVLAAVIGRADVAARVQEAERAVAQGHLLPTRAVRQIVESAGIAVTPH